MMCVTKRRFGFVLTHRVEIDQAWTLVMDENVRCLHIAVADPVARQGRKNMGYFLCESPAF